MGRTLVIAEIGSNYDKDFERAKMLIRAAKDAGADVAKFQTVKAETMCHPDHPAYETIERYALPYEWHKPLADYCREVGIQFASTPGAIDGVALLDSLDVPFIKIGSSNITNLPLIKAAARTRRRLIISTGGATMKEVRDAFRWVGKGARGLTLLQCTISYPTDPENVNLRALENLEISWNVDIGFSDHTLSTVLPAVAVSMGAVVIEKHFKLSGHEDTPDWGHSLNPDEFKKMVLNIREAEVALGDGIKEPLPEEEKMLKSARRGLYFARDLPAGHTLHHGDMIALRPANEISPADEELLYHKMLTKSVKAFDAVSLTAVAEA